MYLQGKWKKEEMFDNKGILVFEAACRAQRLHCIPGWHHYFKNLSNIVPVHYTIYSRAASIHQVDLCYTE